MSKIINQKGEIFRIDATHIYSEKQSHKGSQSSPHTFEVKNLAVSIILTLPEFAGFSEFTDAWAYPTKFRYFTTDAEIGAVTKSQPEAIPVLATIRRVNFENGSELYFDTIEPEFENFINLEKLEQNDSIF